MFNFEVCPVKPLPRRVYEPSPGILTVVNMWSNNAVIWLAGQFTEESKRDAMAQE